MEDDKKKNKKQKKSDAAKGEPTPVITNGETLDAEAAAGTAAANKEDLAETPRSTDEAGGGGGGSGSGTARGKKGGKERGHGGKKGKGQKSGGDGGDDKYKGGGGSKTVNVMDDAAMENAHNICHNVQDLLFFRGFYWDGQSKKGKGKSRKKKAGGGGKK